VVPLTPPASGAPRGGCGTVTPVRPLPRVNNLGKPKLARLSQSRRAIFLTACAAPAIGRAAEPGPVEPTFFKLFGEQVANKITLGRAKMLLIL
jgi:hypothetical protein